MAKNNVPRHVGFIPDGNRRWATDLGLSKEPGYAHGINPGLLLYDKCKECGIKEASIYCFTQDNTKRPSIQIQAFRDACVAFAFEIARRAPKPCSGACRSRSPSARATDIRCRWRRRRQDFGRNILPGREPKSAAPCGAVFICALVS